MLKKKSFVSPTRESNRDSDSETEVEESEVEESEVEDESEAEVEDESDAEEEESQDIHASKLSEADPMKVLTVDNNLIPLAKNATAEYNRLKKINSKKLIFHNEKKKDATTYQVFPAQYVAAEVFLQTKGITFFKAKRGFGKTLTAAYAAMQCKRCLIVVPTSTLGPTWNAEIEEYGLFNPKPQLTSIFIYDTTLQKPHRVYLETHRFGENDQIIIICKDSSVGPKDTKYGHLGGAIEIFKRVGFGKHEFTVIVDEGHTKKIPLLTHIQPLFDSKEFPVTRELLMSGSDIKTEYNGFNEYEKKLGGSGFHISHRIISNITNPVPDSEWHFLAMKTPTYHTGVKSWNDAIRNIVSKHRHVVFVSPEDVFETANYNKVFDNKAIYKLTSAKSKISKFEHEKNAVLFLNSSKNVGININGDSMVIVNPGSKTTENILQLIGRILRPKNLLKYVDIYLLNGTNVEFFRTLYAKAFSFDMWEYPFDKDVNAAMVAKAVAFIRALGASPVEINKVDLCIFMANYIDLTEHGVNVPYIQEWWMKNTKNQKDVKNKPIPTILNMDLIEDLATVEIL